MGPMRSRCRPTIVFDRHIVSPGDAGARLGHSWTEIRALGWGVVSPYHHRRHPRRRQHPHPRRHPYPRQRRHPYPRQHPHPRRRRRRHRRRRQPRNQLSVGFPRLRIPYGNGARHGQRIGSPVRMRRPLPQGSGDPSGGRRQTDAQAALLSSISALVPSGRVTTSDTAPASVFGVYSHDIVGHAHVGTLKQASTEPSRPHQSQH